MGWFSSLFSFDTPQDSRKGPEFSSMHDTFSLPTSPSLPSHPDVFNPGSLHTSDPEFNRTPTTSYTYPPQGTVAYGYVPSS